MSARYGLRIGVIAILHTFNGRLEFNSHVHTMVTGGGLHDSSGSWVSRVYCGRDPLMEFWRKAVIELVRTALRASLLQTEMTVDQMEAMLIHQEKRWWSVKIQSFESKEHFLRYAGRYVRRPPIAQRRITRIAERSVTFWTKDKRLGRRVEVQCTPEEFIDRWAQHIPERYKHGPSRSSRFLTETDVLPNLAYEKAGGFRADRMPEMWREVPAGRTGAELKALRA